jgi:hypothetical protein
VPGYTDRRTLPDLYPFTVSRTPSGKTSVPRAYAPSRNLSWDVARPASRGIFWRQYLRNIIRIITETGLRVYKELMRMKKEQVDLENAVAWVPKNLCHFCERPFLGAD